MKALINMASSKFSLGVALSSRYFLSRSARFKNNQVCHKFCQSLFVRSLSTSQVSQVNVKYSNGLPVVTVPLPSRTEDCQFTLKPLSNTVGDFYKFLQEEDGGIDRVSVYRQDGSRISKSTCIENLLDSDFNLVINDNSYSVSPPETVKVSHEHAESLSDVKNMIAQLYTKLNVDQYQLDQERKFQKTIEDIKVELEPLEKMKQQMALNAGKHTNRLTWLGLGLMGFQFGLFARLTWWEYSWDIMEPVTYFATYGTTIVMFAYYVLTKQEYNFEMAHDREYLFSFHRNAKKKKFDVEHYNKLRESLCQAKHDLARLRDPLQLHLPIRELPREVSNV